MRIKMTKIRGRERMRRNSGCSVANIENSTHQDEFSEHKCDYERHAVAWLAARSRNDQKLLQQSAKQMLRHLREMYRLAIASPKRSM